MTEQGQGPAQVSNPREPYVHSGGKQDPGSGIEKPPYDARQKSGKSQDELAKDPNKQQGGADAAPRTVSQAERDGVSDTDATAASPMGVGESINKQGNERMLNKSAEAHDSDQRDIGVGGHTKNVDPEAPDVLTGGQGG